MTRKANHAAARTIVFRVDASLQIGTGHVVRCLTLARALAAQGTECHFVCREHPGNLIETIEGMGFITHRLPLLDYAGTSRGDNSLDHDRWLGASWDADVRACAPLLGLLDPDWLAVDHYALDAKWEKAVLPERAHLLVIDDLANRPHGADLLLDQNLGRAAEDYVTLVPPHCQVLAGPQFALLRPEFTELRAYSLERRRQNPRLKRLLISLGGVDKDNATGEVLDALAVCPQLPNDLEVTVVMGANAPRLNDVTARAAILPWTTEVVIDVPDMARRMADADLAVGAAGSSSWERCCLGLPAMMLVLAENQREVATALDALGAAKLLGQAGDVGVALPAALNSIVPDKLASMSEAAASVLEGTGINKLVKVIQNTVCEAGKLHGARVR